MVLVQEQMRVTLSRFNSLKFHEMGNLELSSALAEALQ